MSPIVRDIKFRAVVFKPFLKAQKNSPFQGKSYPKPLPAAPRPASEAASGNPRNPASHLWGGGLGAQKAGLRPEIPHHLVAWVCNFWAHPDLPHPRLHFYSTPMESVCMAPLSMGLSWPEYWSGMPCPPSGDLPHPGIKLASLTSPASAGGFLTRRWVLYQ